MMLMRVAVLFLATVQLCTGWTALTHNAETATALAALVQTTNWTFTTNTDRSAPHLVVDDGSLLARLPLLRDTHVYQYLYTGVDRLLPQIPPWFEVTNVHQAVDAIAEYVLAAVLGWTLDLASADRAMRRCAWNNNSSVDCASKCRVNHRQLKGLTVGIMGYGHIGAGIATRAAAFGMRIIGTTLHPSSSPPAPLSWLGGNGDNARLASEADFLVLCVPDTPATLGLVDRAMLGHMKSEGVLVNIASARVVDEAALYDALYNGSVGGAVLDTWWNRDWRNASATGTASWPSKHRFDLLEQVPDASRVVIDPTISAHTNESDQLALKEAAANLDLFARGEPLNNIVKNATR